MYALKFIKFFESFCKGVDFEPNEIWTMHFGGILSENLMQNQGEELRLFLNEPKKFSSSWTQFQDGCCGALYCSSNETGISLKGGGNRENLAMTCITMEMGYATWATPKVSEEDDEQCTDESHSHYWRVYACKSSTNWIFEFCFLHQSPSAFS